jgi:hypothetical protein
LIIELIFLEFLSIPQIGDAIDENTSYRCALQSNSIVERGVGGKEVEIGMEVGTASKPGPSTAQRNID